MPGLPRPDLPPGPHRELNELLHELHHAAGWPSLRALAGAAGCSHTTVSHALSSPRLPPWGLVELLVEAMDGDVSECHALWLAASGPDAHLRVVPRLAGRRAELAAVRRHLEAGEGFLVVTGEAGMGKTRLVETATATVAGRVHVARGTCLPLSTQVPLLPVADVLREIHGVDEGRWVEEALVGAPAYVAAALTRVLPEVAALATVDDPDDDWARQRLYNAISTVFVRLASLRPLAVVLEDLHWADAATLDLLEHVVVRPARPPLVGTWRIDDLDTPVATAGWWARVRRAPHVRDIALGPLTREECRDQLAMLGGVDEPTVDRVHARTLGHPLFTEQLVAQSRAGDDGMPSLLADLLDRRLVGLEGPGWRVARALGVADRPLPRDVLLETTELPGGQLDAALRELADHRLLADSASGAAQLRHPLLAAAVRRRLVPGEGAVEHRRLALALAGTAAPAAAEVAAHWQAADDPAEELPWRLAAAREASARHAAAQATEHWTRVLELWPPGATTCGTPPVQRADAWFGVMDGHDLAGQAELAVALTERAMGEMDSWPAEQQAELLLRAGDYLSKRDHIGAGIQLLESAIAIYRGLPMSRGLPRALGHLAVGLSHLGRTEEAAELLEEAGAGLVSLGLVAELRWLTTNMAWLDARRGDVERAASRIKEVDEATPPDPDPIIELIIGVNHTDLLLMTCRRAAEVADVADRYLRRARGQGVDTFERTVLVANVALAWLRAGQVERAQTVVAAAVRPGSPDPWLLRVLAASAEAIAGQREEARRDFEELHSEPGAQLQFLAAEEAAWELWDGHPDRALAVLSDLFSRRSGPNIPGDTGGALALCARAAADLAASDRRHGTPAGRRALAEQVAAMRAGASFDPFTPENPPADRLAQPQWTAELARLAGTETVEQWLAAAASWEAAGRPHDASYCRWRAALVARRTGQAGVADRLLRRAAREAREHQPLLSAIRATAGQA